MRFGAPVASRPRIRTEARDAAEASIDRAVVTPTLFPARFRARCSFHSTGIGEGIRSCMLAGAKPVRASMATLSHYGPHPPDQVARARPAWPPPLGRIIAPSSHTSRLAIR